jgi:hypothetical protein
VWQSGTGRYTGTASIGELKRFEALVRADERKIVMNEPLTKEMWQRFEDEIRADEREACAKVCDDLPAPDVYSDTDKSMWDVTCVDCAEAIRARGETK